MSILVLRKKKIKKRKRKKEDVVGSIKKNPIYQMRPEVGCRHNITTQQTQTESIGRHGSSVCAFFFGQKQK
jgi:hypothetical protein